MDLNNNPAALCKTKAQCGGVSTFFECRWKKLIPNNSHENVSCSGFLYVEGGKLLRHAFNDSLCVSCDDKLFVGGNYVNLDLAVGCGNFSLATAC